MTRYASAALVGLACIGRVAAGAPKGDQLASAAGVEIVRDIVKERPDNVQIWSIGEEEKPFDRPAPIVLDPTVLKDFRGELNYMQDVPSDLNVELPFNATSQAFVAAIPHAHVQGPAGLVFDDAGRVFHEKNMFFERVAESPVPVKTDSVRRFGLLATTIQKYGHMYFHFLSETLQKFALLKPHLDAHPELKVLSWGSAYEPVFLERMGIDPARIVKYEPYQLVEGEDIPKMVDYEADALLFPTPSVRITPSREGLLLTRAALGVIDQDGETSPQRTKVIYCTRDGESSRRVSNEAEVLNSLRTAIDEINAIKGTELELVIFDGVKNTPESLSETIKLFGDAVAVLGPHGAGLSHILFAPRDTAVIEFQFLRDPPMMFWHIAAALDQHYHMVPVPGAYWMSEEMDVPANDVSDLLKLALGQGIWHRTTEAEAQIADCAPGQHAETIILNSEQPKCEPCAPGRYSSAGSSFCRTCKPNTWSAGVGQDTCTPCPDSRVAWLPGSRFESDCLSAQDHLRMLHNVEENLLKLNKLSPIHHQAARRVLGEMDGYGIGSVGASTEPSDSAHPHHAVQILDPHVVAIAAEEERSVLAAYHEGSAFADLSHLATGDPGPGASALCRLQRISQAAGGWDNYGGSIFLERDYCADPVSAYSDEVYAFSRVGESASIGFVEMKNCPSGYAQMDPSSRSGFSCVTCDMLMLLPLAECGSETSDEAHCCSALSAWTFGGCLCHDAGMELARSLGASESLAIEGAEACEFDVESIPRPSQLTCVQNKTSQSIRDIIVEQVSSGATKSACLTISIAVAVAFLVRA